MDNALFLSVEDDDNGMRFDRWLGAHFPRLGRSNIQKLLRTGQIRLDGRRARGEIRLLAGQTIRMPPFVMRQQETGSKEAEDGHPNLSGVSAAAQKETRDQLENMLIHEDDHILVFNKPAGLAVQGGSGLNRHMDGLLQNVYGRGASRPRLVHRLDRDTSGVLIVAKTGSAARQLSLTFRERRCVKLYWSLNYGVPRRESGKIVTYIARDEKSERMQIERYSSEQTRKAVSYFQLIEQNAEKFSFLVLRPITGRTHQLRAHSSHIGNPIIGDSKYFSIENWKLPGGIQNRLHLHARRLILPHPSGSGQIDLVAPLPDHMRQSWSLLGLQQSDGDALSTL